MKPTSLQSNKKSIHVFIIVIVGLLLLSAGIAYRNNAYQRIAKNQKEVDSVFTYSEIQKPMPQPKLTVSIGMDYSTVRDLCGIPDDTRTLESRRGDFIILEYEYKSSNSEKGCYGSFTFINSTLDSIYRN